MSDPLDLAIPEAGSSLNIFLLKLVWVELLLLEMGRVLWTEEPGGLLSMGSHRVGYDCSDLVCMHALKKEMATHSSILAWRIPGMEEPVGCRLWGRTELDMTDVT